MNLTYVISSSSIDAGMATAILNMHEPIENWFIAARNKKTTIGWSIPKQCKLLLLDFTFPEKVMNSLEREYELVFLDRKNPKLYDIPGEEFRDPTRSTAENVWYMLYPNQEPPTPIKLMSDYITWTHSNNCSKAFYLGIKDAIDTIRLRDYQRQRELEFWKELLTSKALFNQILRIGTQIERFQKTMLKVLGENCAFETSFNGHSALAINARLYDSSIFNAHPKINDVELLIAFDYTPASKKTQEAASYNLTLYPGPAHPDICPRNLVEHLGGSGSTTTAFLNVPELPFALPKVAENPTIYNFFDSLIKLRDTDHRNMITYLDMVRQFHYAIYGPYHLDEDVTFYYTNKPLFDSILNFTFDSSKFCTHGVTIILRKDGWWLTRVFDTTGNPYVDITTRHPPLKLKDGVCKIHAQIIDGVLCILTDIPPFEHLEQIIYHALK